MNILAQIGIVFFLATIADFIAKTLPIPIPPSIIGIVLILVLLSSNLLKIDHIQNIADFFLNNMAFFFIAAGVSIISKYQLIEQIWWQFALILFITTLTTFAITGLAVKYAMKLQNNLIKKVKS